MEGIKLIIMYLLRGIANYAHTFLLVTGLALFCVTGFLYSLQIGFVITGASCIALSVLLVKSGGEN
ncbi:hypothetical protein [Paenilisteria newyorkensis]|uniref:hypothetical protein n=1 Tax=Listeria newyorkensis TaxID=1497681 RepID=UPI000740E558|nr:hypothetical protein [Listeria newyorkensis]